VTVDRLPGGRFVVGASDTGALVALLLRRQRQRAGLSLAEVSRAMGARSRNAYARYERGTSVPTIEKLGKLLQAVAPGHTFVLDQVAWRRRGSASARSCGSRPFDRPLGPGRSRRPGSTRTAAAAPDCSRPTLASAEGPGTLDEGQSAAAAGGPECGARRDR